MLQNRVIPCLLLRNGGLVKTIKFDHPKYIGDPINAVKIFNDKEVDELIFLDITATKERRGPHYELIEKIASECFMPFCYGGGVTRVEQIRRIFNLGVEKISICTYAANNPNFIKETAEVFGSQSIVVTIDVKKDRFSKNYWVYAENGRKKTRFKLKEFAQCMEYKGAGEIIINSIDRDGTMEGYDLVMVKEVSEAVNIPVIALGGAGKLRDIAEVINVANASAAAAGSLFVFYGKLRAVLINYPTRQELESILNLPFQ